MKVVRALGETAWRRFVAGHPQSNIFHTPEMFQVFAQARNHRPTLWAAVDDGGEVLALLLPVEVAVLGGLFRRLTSRAIAYGGVLCAPGPEGRAALAALLQAYNPSVRGRSLFTELRHLSDTGALQPVLADHGFVYEEHLNYLVDLNRPPEAVLQSIGRRTRKKIRRGLRQGTVVIREATQPEEAALCYELLAQTYAQAQVPLADRSLFEAAFAVLHPRGMVQFLLAQVGDAYAAASVELLHKDTIYGWYGGTDRRYSRHAPTELLIWRILRWGAENGYRLYDFGGAGKPGEAYGVRDFKAKFGGRLVSFGRNVHVHAPRRLWLSERGYRLLRKWL